jgi:acetate kinase
MNPLELQEAPFLGGQQSATPAWDRQAQAVLPFNRFTRERVLVINQGSSSVKWSYFDTGDEAWDVHGKIQREGSGQARLLQEGRGRRMVREVAPGDEFAALLEALQDANTGVGPGFHAISLIAHRFVHGGTRFVAPAMIDDRVLDELEHLKSLAPLHNPLCIEGIRKVLAAFPATPQVAVFDTAFHAGMPVHARLYGLPYSYYEKLGIRRFGFHGLSHAFALRAAAYFLGSDAADLKVVSCHLGGGASVCAINRGRSVDTTMGFSPGEGLVMGTRCGDIDVAVLSYLAQEKGYTWGKIEHLLNEESGLLGISGISQDIREIEAAANRGHRRALLALSTFSHRVRKAIGAAVATLGGADVVLFTGGIGQGSAAVRTAALHQLGCMGIALDPERNQACKGDVIERISTDTSAVAVLVIPAGEERMIAHEALAEMSSNYLVQTRKACLTEPIPIEVSAHHVHLSEDHVRELFGPDHTLMRARDLSQPGQYACAQTVTIVGPAGSLENVRVLGPPRKATQVEIAMSEQFKLGLHPPVRESGDLAGSCGCTLVGPAGQVTLKEGVICAMRHIHMAPADALRYGVRDGSVVRVRVEGDRELIFGDVKVRVRPEFRLAMHLDTDEANAADLESGARGFIDGIQAEDGADESCASREPQASVVNPRE